MDNNNNNNDFDFELEFLNILLSLFGLVISALIVAFVVSIIWNLIGVGVFGAISFTFFQIYCTSFLLTLFL